MHWNYFKWKLPSECREKIIDKHTITECRHINLVLQQSKKYEIFKLITENGREINIFCKGATDYEMKMHRRIWELVHGETRSAKVPKCFGFWKNKLFLEYIPYSITFEQFLSSNHSLEELEAILEQLGIFLAILHNNRIQHKDLNLNNILYSTKTRTTYVIDFEISEENPVKTYLDSARDIFALKKHLTKHVGYTSTINALSSSYNLKTTYSELTTKWGDGFDG